MGIFFRPLTWVWRGRRTADWLFGGREEESGRRVDPPEVGHTPAAVLRAPRAIPRLFAGPSGVTERAGGLEMGLHEATDPTLRSEATPVPGGLLPA